MPPENIKTVVVMSDVAYLHQAGNCEPVIDTGAFLTFLVLDSILSSLRSALSPNVPVVMQRFESRLVLPASLSSKGVPGVQTSSASLREHHVHRYNRISPNLRHEDCIIYYIGGESLGLTNILLTHASCDVSIGYFP